MQRTVLWDDKWANSFTHLFKDVIGYDNRSDGRTLEPILIHGDVWEQNVGIDKETGETLVSDPGYTYAHDDMKFGTWRGSWASYLSEPV
ncbi:hypothetical protein MCOR02_006267 [Pyricularia oryzae]|uniref:Protein-ribulosamine 3-kinase n=1 Tax=Pyricularia oryzae TaxID=318829 RepID=A0A4P7NJR5_PYROR|nr:hypothetical protein MCOR02_006267 [Pyricularia oryzae]KAI6307131.1 hypothetical protein MCOR29_009802 [Pyricularia oryzae]KAI6316235.1 hypothetical protein MCOR34_004378 [Pyricularia oryzae]KAI6343116.1 hypothetical protein MCOR30_001560 [Pyricularia oryzae]KAI6367301.1 hypothetical protein MCOR32_007205 [Pyricularia oryzae]